MEVTKSRICQCSPTGSSTWRFSSKRCDRTLCSSRFVMSEDSDDDDSLCTVLNNNSSTPSSGDLAVGISVNCLCLLTCLDNGGQ